MRYDVISTFKDSLQVQAIPTQHLPVFHHPFSPNDFQIAWPFFSDYSLPPYPVYMQPTARAFCLQFQQVDLDPS